MSCKHKIDQQTAECGPCLFTDGCYYIEETCEKCKTHFITCQCGKMNSEGKWPAKRRLAFLKKQRTKEETVEDRAFQRGIHPGA